METITFYSYKGGVGRTLALANIAMYLRRFGLNVCLMDFDLEAPGLHYKFIKNPKPEDIKSGLLDYIYEFTSKDIIPESFAPYSMELASQTEKYGSIRLIPAGNVLSAEYWKKLASIDWYSLFYRDDSEGVPFFLELKKRIEIEFNPDFLLIDSRTGVTEMGGVCTALLPDKVVFLIANNQENIDGARQILRGIQKVERLPGQKPIDVALVLTRIPFPEKSDFGEDKVKEYERSEEEILDHLANSLNESIYTSEKRMSIEDICILHSDRQLEMLESLRLEKDGRIKENLLTQDYLKFFSRIIPREIISARIAAIRNMIANDNNLARMAEVSKYLNEIEILQRN